MSFKKQGDFGTLFFEVKDSGIGMTNENLIKIFKPFYKIENNSGTEKGLGLGLSLGCE